MWDPRGVGRKGWRKGGRSRSPEKQRAVRLNGRLGGRPPREPDPDFPDGNLFIPPNTKEMRRKFIEYEIVRLAREAKPGDVRFIVRYFKKHTNRSVRADLSETQVRDILYARGLHRLWKKLNAPPP